MTQRSYDFLSSNEKDHLEECRRSSLMTLGQAAAASAGTVVTINSDGLGTNVSMGLRAASNALNNLCNGRSIVSKYFPTMPWREYRKVLTCCAGMATAGTLMVELSAEKLGEGQATLLGAFAPVVGLVDFWGACDLAYIRKVTPGQVPTAESLPHALIMLKEMVGRENPGELTA
ncbi:hypothetical protein ACWEPM_28460 [Streptomyces sp. NPDC004244]